MYIDDFFTNTVQVKFAKLCFIITLLGVYQFIPGLMTMTLFQGQRFVRIVNCKLFSRFLPMVVSQLYGSCIHYKDVMVDV